MWLIDIACFKLKYFADERNVRYAILSHRWEEEEFSFQEMQSLSDELRREITSRLVSDVKGEAIPPPLSSGYRQGLRKIEMFCRQANSEGYQYAWADTCCIDKSSSAELSEAINSMYRWYQAASVCYAYLSDISENITKAELQASQWFTRGWTLQELLAPTNVLFFSRSWHILGTKHTLCDDIHVATKIDQRAITGDTAIVDYSVGQRLSWAARRATTRVEDRSYCLMGIFGINMPLLYGEGQNAFLRLQKKILKQADDKSIFVWRSDGSDHPGLLAKDLDHFKGIPPLQMINSTQQSRPHRSIPLFVATVPLSVTNLGIFCQMMMQPCGAEMYAAFLECKDSTTGVPVRLILRKLRVQGHTGLFVRVAVQTSNLDELLDAPAFVETKCYVKHCHCHHFLSAKPFFDDTTVLVPQNLVQLKIWPESRLQALRVPTLGLRINLLPQPDSVTGSHLFTVHPRDSWNARTQTLGMSEGRVGPAGIIIFKDKPGVLLFVKLGFDWHYNPICVISSKNDLRNDKGILTDIPISEDHHHYVSLDVMRHSSWNEVIPTDDTIDCVLPTQGQQRFWAIKGDFMDQLRVRVFEEIDKWHYRSVFKVSLKRNFTNFKEAIWNVDITKDEYSRIPRGQTLTPGRLQARWKS